jgi:hypothetical protein
LSTTAPPRFLDTKPGDSGKVEPVSVARPEFSTSSTPPYGVEPVNVAVIPLLNWTWPTTYEPDVIEASRAWFASASPSTRMREARRVALILTSTLPSTCVPVSVQVAPSGTTSLPGMVVAPMLPVQFVSGASSVGSAATAGPAARAVRAVRAVADKMPGRFLTTHSPQMDSLRPGWPE